MTKTKNKSLLLTLGTVLAVLFAIVGGVLMLGTKTTQANAPAVVKADEPTIVQSGDGWTLNSEGVLYIGKTAAETNERPWSTYKTSIYEVVIDDTAEYIYEKALQSCSNVRKITMPWIPIKVLYYDFYTTFNHISFLFRSGYSLGDFYVDSSSHRYMYMESSLKEVVITSGTIGSHRFHGLEYLEKVDLSMATGDICSSGWYDGFFGGCTRLTDVKFPQNCTEIKDSAFSGCSSLQSISIPNTVTKIGNYAFSGCSSLTSINIPSGLTTIGNGAFYDCSGLENVNNLYKGVYYTDNTFAVPYKVAAEDLTQVTNIEFHQNMRLIYAPAVSELVNLEAVKWEKNGDAFTFKDGLLTLVSDEYRNQNGDFPWGLIQHLTFSVDFASDVTVVPQGAFSNYPHLTEVNIPNNIIEIGSGAFNGCDKLVRLTLGSGLQKVGANAFYANTDVVLHIYINATKSDFSNATNRVIEEYLDVVDTLNQDSNNIDINELSQLIGDLDAAEALVNQLDGKTPLEIAMNWEFDGWGLSDDEYNGISNAMQTSKQALITYLTQFHINYNKNTSEEALQYATEEANLVYPVYQALVARDVVQLALVLDGGRIYDKAEMLIKQKTGYSASEVTSMFFQGYNSLASLLNDYPAFADVIDALDEYDAQDDSTYSPVFAALKQVFEDADNYSSDEQVDAATQKLLQAYTALCIQDAETRQAAIIQGLSQQYKQSNSDAYNWTNDIISQYDDEKSSSFLDNGWEFYLADTITTLKGYLDNLGEDYTSDELETARGQVLDLLAVDCIRRDTDSYLELLTPKTAQELVIMEAFNAPSVQALIDDGMTFVEDIMDAFGTANATSTIADILENVGAPSDVAMNYATLMVSLYTALAKQNISRDEVGSVLVINSPAYEDALDMIGDIRKSSEEIVARYIAAQYNISNQSRIEALQTALESGNIATITTWFRNSGLTSQITSNAVFDFVGQIANGISYKAPSEVMMSDLEYVIDEGNYSIGEIVNYNDSYDFSSVSVRPVQLHYDESLTEEFEEVFEDAPAASITLDDTYVVESAPEPPATGVAVVDIVLPVAFIAMVLAATVVVWKKKEQY